MSHALSDEKDKDFTRNCSVEHTEHCQDCNTLVEVLNRFENKVLHFKQAKIPSARIPPTQ